MKNCIFSGAEIDDNRDFAPEFSFKKMCINCEYAHKDDDGSIYCYNEANKEKAQQAVLEAATKASPSYAITNINFELSPIALKKPLCKCGEWELSKEVVDLITSSFV